MFLEKIEMDFIEPCTADFMKMKFTAEFSSDISGIFPYINSVIKAAIYNEGSSSLTIRKDGRLITLHPLKMAVSKALNEHDAYEIIDMIKELVNSVHERRDEIIPLYSRRQNPSAVEVYRYLPKTNCRACDEMTCLSFAVKMIEGQKKLSECSDILKKEHIENQGILSEMAQTFGWL